MYNRKLKKLTARVSTIPFELNRQLVLTAWHLTQATLLFKKKKRLEIVLTHATLEAIK